MFGTNPNDFQGIPETFAKEYQITHLKKPVFPVISNYRLVSGLKVGDTAHRTYASTPNAKRMGGDGSFSPSNRTDTKESLSIDKEYESSFYIKELDELQNNLPVRSKHAKLSSAAIFNQIDGDILGLYDQFTPFMDARHLGGTAGEGIEATTGNIRKIFIKAREILEGYDILLDPGAKFTGFKAEDSDQTMGVAILSPFVKGLLVEALGDKDSALGDKVAVAGHAGVFNDFQIFVSNALGWSGELAMATNPTANDTVIINGVTLTLKSSISVAGDVLIGASADATRENLENAINGGTGAGSTYIEVSTANRELLNNITATNDDTANTLSIKATGYGRIAVSETLTAAADVWTATKQVQHNLMGAANAIDVVLQKEPSMKNVPVEKHVGEDVVVWAACGYKVFYDGTTMMVDVRIRTDKLV